MEPHLEHAKPMLVAVSAGGVYTSISQKENAKTVKTWRERESIYVVCQLTFAGSSTLRPQMIDVFIADSSTVLIPSTAGSATTDSTGSFERAALWTRHLIGRGDTWRSRVGWRGHWHTHY